jgi:ATP/maltotriose-dependent transcriptional regulator MalT
MLWQHYIYRRGGEIYPTWEMALDKRKVRLLYIAGCGFDVRTQKVMREFVRSLRESSAEVENAQLILARFSGYQLDQALKDQTKNNETALTEIFGELGRPTYVTFGAATLNDEFSVSTAMRQGVAEVVEYLADVTDVVLDVSSVPRVVYLSLLTGLREPLSERELEVLRLIVCGDSNQEIAEALVLSIDTIKRHVSNIFSKLGVNNRVQAVVQAHALGLLSVKA